MIYVLFAVHNRKEKTLHCLKCLDQQTFRDFQIVIFDDGSNDGTSEAIAQLYPGVKILKGDGTYWWSKSMNEGLRYIFSVASPADHVLTLNDDTSFDSDYFRFLSIAAQQEPHACIGTIYTKDGQSYEAQIGIDWQKYQYSGNKFDLTALKHSPLLLDGTDTLPCRGTLIPLSVFERIGIFDQKRLPHYAADYDFFLRAKKAKVKLLICSKSITFDMSPSQGPVPAGKGLAYALFDIRSAVNLKAHCVLIYRHCPGFLKKLSNMLRFVKVIINSA